MLSLSSFGAPLLTLVLAALWLTAASAAAHRLVGAAGDALDRTLAAGLAGGFLGIVIVLVVGSAGMLDRPAASYLAWAAVAAIACGIARVSPLAALRTFGGAAGETLDRVFAARFGARSASLALAVPAVLILADRVVIPPTAWDALTYHLTFPLHWLQSGELTTLSFGAGDPSPEYYPLDVEMLFYYGFAATRSDWWAAFAQVPPLLGAAAAIAGIARRCGAGREDASLAALLWMSLPLILRSAFEPTVDLFLAAFFLSALYFLLRFLETPAGGGGMLLAASLGAGLVAGTKYTGLFLAAAGLAPAGVPVLRRLVRAPVAGSAVTPAAGLLVALVAGGYVYARNLWIGANPFLPMEVAFGGSILVPGSIASDAYFQHPASRLTLARFLASPRALLDFGPAFAPLLAVPVAALARTGRRPHPERAPVLITAIVFALVMLVFLLVIPYRENRHLLVPVGLGCALLAALLPRVRRAVPWVIVVNAPFALYYWGKDMVLGGAQAHHATAVAGLALLMAGTDPRWRAAVAGQLSRLVQGLPSAFVVMVLLGVAWTAAALAHEGYHRHRYDGWLRFWSSRYEGRQGFSHRSDWAEAAEAWCRIAELTDDAASTIAYVGNNLPYPLAGRDLANRVVFVPRTGGAAFTGFRRRDSPRDGPESATAWLERLRALGVDYLCVFRHDPDDDPGRALPVEAGWADDRPETFEPVYGTEAARIYRVR
jgi:hypothetical protein